MIERLLILLVGALGIGLYLPASRELILTRAEPILRPACQWATARELLGMGCSLSAYVAGRDGEAFLRRELDSWGKPHIAEVYLLSEEPGN
jgi:hypothetical protein